MRENIDLLTAMKKIENYAINSFKPNYVTANTSPGNVAQYSDFIELPQYIINQVPNEILELYGEEKGTLEWKEIATSFFKLVVICDTRVEVNRLMRALLAVLDEERKFMYKGKDGKDYTSSEQVKSVNEFYTQQENPTQKNGRGR